MVFRNSAPSAYALGQLAALPAMHRAIVSSGSWPSGARSQEEASPGEHGIDTPLA
jgi:hypothetical protein